MKLFEQLHKKLMEQLDATWDSSDEEILVLIDELILNNSREHYLSLYEKMQIRQELFYSVRKLDVLQELLEDNSITEIMVNGWNHIFIEQEGHLHRLEKAFTSKEKLDDVIQQIVGRCNRVVNTSKPIVDARLENGARVNIVISPVALNGPILTIRRFPDKPITLDKLVVMKSVTQEAADFLIQMVQSKYSIMIGGCTGAGKTTFLNALSNYIPKEERIITIEDNAELQIQGVANLVQLEVKESNMEGSPEIMIRDLIKTALRMRPDRIVVGEVRGKECMDLLQALNTGHEGSLSSAHANSAKDMIGRLETMVLMGIALPLEAIRRQIAAGFNLLVHMGRMQDKSRQILEITEVVGYRDGEVELHPIFTWKEGEGLVKVGNLVHGEKLERASVQGEKKL